MSVADTGIGNPGHESVSYLRAVLLRRQGSLSRARRDGPWPGDRTVDCRAAWWSDFSRSQAWHRRHFLVKIARNLTGSGRSRWELGLQTRAGFSDPGFASKVSTRTRIESHGHATPRKPRICPGPGSDSVTRPPKSATTRCQGNDGAGSIAQYDELAASDTRCVYLCTGKPETARYAASATNGLLNTPKANPG